MPKLKKVAKPKEEPKKEEPKRTKVKIPKAKKYEDLPEIPDYERPDLEIYEESEFDPTKLERAVETPMKQAEQPVEIRLEAEELPKNGLPKVSIFVVCANFLFHTIKSYPHLALGVRILLCTKFVNVSFCLCPSKLHR